MAAKPYRLLALVKQDAVVRVQKEPDDTVMTWPHLLSIEFFAAAMMSIFLLFMGLFINAPLEELANTERDAGGRQGALVLRRAPGAPRLFPPHGRRRAGADRHPRRPGVHPLHRPGTEGRWRSPRPSDRKARSMLFTISGPGLAITFLGAFFRGPGYAWTLPWDGFYFAL